MPANLVASELASESLVVHPAIITNARAAIVIFMKLAFCADET